MEIPDWSRLLHLYSRFKPGITVYEWMEEYGAHELEIEVRRFASFGVVKVRDTCDSLHKIALLI